MRPEPVEGRVDRLSAHVIEAQGALDRNHSYLLGLSGKRA
jgi:hypothetical protein